MTEKMVKTAEEWKEQRTPDQYEICSNHGTETALSGNYNDSKYVGEYKWGRHGEVSFASDTNMD